MANWCYSDITFYSHDKEVITDFHDRINDVLEKPSEFADRFDMSSDWLGNFLLMAGFDKKDIIENKIPFQYRGEIQDFYDVGEVNGFYCFRLNTETAWNQNIVMWEEIIKKLYPDKDVRIAYSSDLSDEGEYYKYDPENLFYQDDYYADCYIDNPDVVKKAFPHLTSEDLESWDATEETAVKNLQHILNTDETDMDVLLELLEDFNEKLDEFNGSYLNVHKYEICKNEWN